eukprot:TRINITY_DN47180_c0_g1_i1.p1 TRINITY_DN47180_c0_g1~~TRINITY_DN47180_c0_g1_i1.p1  ORF type:complete len:866 (-),score=151.61 TRINITY_DN47180_c0_g1_i1:100-2649(-)
MSKSLRSSTQAKHMYEPHENVDEPLVGDEVEVARHGGEWVRARITEMNASDQKVKVQFEADGYLHQKTLLMESPHLRLSTQVARRSERGHSQHSNASRGESMGEDAGRRRKTDRDVDDDVRERFRFLHQVELMQRLSEEDLLALAERCLPVHFEKGYELIKQGEVGDALFIVVSGSVRVLVDNETVAKLGRGDYFGETALLYHEPRGATVKAMETVYAMSVSAELFQDLGLDTRLEFPRRQAIGGGLDRPVARKCSQAAKTLAERKLICTAIKKNPVLVSLFELDDARCNAMANAMWSEKVAAGKQIITEGDVVSDYFYVVSQGKFEVLVSQHTLIEPGGSFGELALLYPAPRAATVKAVTDAVVWVIDRHQFKSILQKPLEEVVHSDKEFLDELEAFNSFSYEEKLEVARALVEVTFRRGDCLYQEGEQSDAFYIVYDGEISVSKGRRSVNKIVCSAEHAELFSHASLRTGGVHTETATVVSQACKALAMDKATLDLLLCGDKTRHSSIRPPSLHVSFEDEKVERIRRSDLQILGLLGCGGFGEVNLVEHRTTGATYALKGVSKGFIVKSGMQSSVVNERNIQLMCDSKFVVQLYETYNSKDTLYFLLELALGGELYATYRRKSLYGSAKHAQFYIAGTVLALEHLHARNIIHRDLKPENLLLDSEGHVKITDMGLAKVVVGKSYTTCGTPEYFAPEVIASTGHTRAVDWWATGILVFELMAGRTPFASESSETIYSRIARGIKAVAFPKRLAGPCENLVRAMCHHSPSERLAMRQGGAINVKRHQWLESIDWYAMERQAVAPPYVPQVASAKDLANFPQHAEQVRRPPRVSYKDDESGWDAGFATSD